MAEDIICTFCTVQRRGKEGRKVAWRQHQAVRISSLRISGECHRALCVTQIDIASVHKLCMYICVKRTWSWMQNWARNRNTWIMVAYKMDFKCRIQVLLWFFKDTLNAYCCPSLDTAAASLYPCLCADHSQLGDIQNPHATGIFWCPSAFSSFCTALPLHSKSINITCSHLLYFLIFSPNKNDLVWTLQ